VQDFGGAITTKDKGTKNQKERSIFKKKLKDP
jgi:hypothetical protein